MSIIQALWDSYLGTPIVTRMCSTFTVFLAVALQMDLVSKFSLHFSPDLTFRHLQFWRLLTCFFYIERVDIGFIFSLVFLHRHSSAVESAEFGGKTEDFVLMIGFGMWVMLVCAYVAGELWLHEPLGMFVLYVWARRNPNVHVEVLGLVFPAAYLPIFFAAITIMFSHAMPDMIGFLAGHIYYHAYFVFPNLPNGFHILQAPAFMKQWFHSPESETLIYPSLEEDIRRYDTLGNLDASTSTPDQSVILRPYLSESELDNENDIADEWSDYSSASSESDAQ